MEISDQIWLHILGRIEDDPIKFKRDRPVSPVDVCGLLRCGDAFECVGSNLVFINGLSFITRVNILHHIFGVLVLSG